MKKLIAVLAVAVVLAIVSWASIFNGGGEEVTVEPAVLEGKWVAILAATPTPTVTPSPTATPEPTPTVTPEAEPVWTWTPTPEPVVVVTAAAEKKTVATQVPTLRPTATPAPVATPRPIVTPPPVATPTPTPTPTPSPVPTPVSPIHVGDLDSWGGFNSATDTGWVRIVVHDAQHNPVPYTYVEAEFFLDGVFHSRAHTAGYSISGTVMYWHNDRRTFVHSFPPGILTYRVTDLRTYTYYGIYPVRVYDPAQNHDPDIGGSSVINEVSDGTIIEVSQE